MQAEGEVRRLEKSLAELVNEKRVWELERCEFNETLAQIQRRYQEERAALEGKVHEIESAFDQAIELELRRRTPDRQVGVCVCERERENERERKRERER